MKLFLFSYLWIFADLTVIPCLRSSETCLRPISAIMDILRSLDIMIIIVVVVVVIVIVIIIMTLGVDISLSVGLQGT